MPQERLSSWNYGPSRPQHSWSEGCRRGIHAAAFANATSIGGCGHDASRLAAFCFNSERIDGLPEADPMPNSDDLTDLKIAKSEAQTETKNCADGGEARSGAVKN